MDFSGVVCTVFAGECPAVSNSTPDEDESSFISGRLAEIESWLDEKLANHPFREEEERVSVDPEGRLGPKRSIFDVTEDGSILVSKDKLTLQSQNAFSTVKANCCVYAGRWMYEVQLRSKGVMQIGWCSAHCRFTQDTGVGDTRYSYGLDGSKQRIWHVYTQKYGPFWRSGDIFGICVDMDEGKIEYYRNGTALGEAFKDIERGPGLALYPAVSLAFNDSLTANFGGSPLKHPIDGYRCLQDPPNMYLFQADYLLKYLVNLSGAISRQSQTSNYGESSKRTGISLESCYMLLASILIEKLAPLLANTYVVEDKVFKYIKGMCVLRSNAKVNESPIQPGSLESTLGSFLTLLWTYLEPEEMKHFLKKLLNFLANTYKETPLDLEYEKQRKIIVILTCICQHPQTRKYLLEYKFFRKNCLPLFLYTKPPDEATLEQLLPDDAIWTEGLGGSKDVYMTACDKLKAHTGVLYTLQKNLIHILLNNRDGDENCAPSSRKIFMEKLRKFVMDNNSEMRGLLVSSTQPAIGLSFLCTLLDVARTLWDEEVVQVEANNDQQQDGSGSGSSLQQTPFIDYRFFYDGTFKYTNVDRIGGVLSYLKKHFRTQLVARLGEKHPSLATVEQASDLRNEIAAFNAFLDSAIFLVSAGPNSSYSAVTRVASNIASEMQQHLQQQQQQQQGGESSGASRPVSGQGVPPNVPCSALDDRLSICDLLDCAVTFYFSVAHKYVVMIADLRDNISHLSDILLETKTNCDDVVHNLEELKRAACQGGNSGFSKTHEELMQELDTRFGQRKSIFAKRSMELARKQAWYRSVALGNHRRSLLCWLMEIIFKTVQGFSAEDDLFSFLPETYINVIPILLDTILDFSFHDIAIQHELSADRKLIDSAAEFLASHLADSRVILASCKDALIQALGSLTCHEAGIRSLEQCSHKSQQALIRALLRPYENRAWGQSNWLLLRFWLGDGFAYRESRPPCVWQSSKQPMRSLGLYRSRAKNGTHTGLLHLIAPACPSKHFQQMICEMLSKDEPYCTTFMNSVLSQLNWAFSEFIHILQDIQNASQRDDQQVVETKQLKICSMCFELTVSLMRALEMILTITPGLLQDVAGGKSEIILGRICQLVIQVLSRVTAPPGCFQFVMDLCLPDLSNVTHFTIISAAIGILLALMRNELLLEDTAGGSGVTKVPRISKHLLTDTSFHISSLEFALGEIKTPIATSSDEAPRGNFDPKMRAHIDPLTNEVRVPSPFRVLIGTKEIVPDPPIIKFNMADYPSHVSQEELNRVRRLIEFLQLRQTLLSEITVFSEESLCPICYAKQNSAVFHPCQHQSCENCIIQHLMNNKLCFYCKNIITKVDRSDGFVLYENNAPFIVPSLPQTTSSSQQTEDPNTGGEDEGDGPSDP
ncbi:E3 ubiquitin-protein ligase RNF123 [Uranotaenia lowii]|uniref:E3 ubiquitin-protein ligase RNF123 n=1 Tax=Uranotaenia lowii TaxID=190385 RepID=UPI00247A7DAA|nr:E3 ubiquitin-protein ligase RNF123 [Uranotaenia lowii]